MEAANRAEASALLIRLGYKVYRPEADDDGEDLILRSPEGGLITVQLKARLHAEWSKYGGKGIWMLFPSAPWQQEVARDWYLVPHDALHEKLAERHGHTASFRQGRWTSMTPAKWLLEWLAPYELTA